MNRTLPAYLLAATLAILCTRPASAAPPPLSIQSGVELRWPTSTGNTYRVQWSLAPGASWTDLGAALPGNGTTNSLYDPVPSATRLYRVLEIVPGSVPAASIPVNGGFESGNGASATNWSAAGGKPPVRTNAFARSGAFSMRGAITNTTATAGEGTLTQLAVAQGGAVAGGQTYAFSFWARRSVPGLPTCSSVRWSG